MPIGPLTDRLRAHPASTTARGQIVDGAGKSGEAASGALADDPVMEAQPYPLVVVPVIRQLGLMRPTVRVEGCVCGGEIVATRDTHEEIAYAVLMHQQDPLHVQWRQRARLGVKHHCPSCGDA